MHKRLFSGNLLIMLLLDGILVAACHLGAYLVRFDFGIPAAEMERIGFTLPGVIVVKLGVFSLFGLYRGMWRYTSLVDLINVIKAVFVSSAVILALLLFLFRFHGYPRSVYLIDAVLTLVAIGGLRVAIRLYFAERTGGQVFPILHLKGDPKKKQLLIIGAGDAGEKVLREVRDNPGLKYEPVGFLDDDPGKRGKAIHGVPVLGAVDDIDRLKVDFDEILIAVPSARGDQMRRIVAACERTGKRYRTVPGIGELINGRVSIKAVREVTLEDLIGREEVRLDQEEIAAYLKNKRVLVTGAGGSIGSELVRQICRFHPRALALVDVSELNLFRVEMACQQLFGYVDQAGYLVDIRRKGTVERVFRQFLPEVVFHAAAYKHVPIQEMHPWEAVYANVLGTRNVVELSVEFGVERFVLVSTDKAVRPHNVMGATKRVAEMLVESMQDNGRTRLLAVRFGNVVGSSGSAVPIFQEQIARGGPVTVTHPEVTRYFMSIPEAAQLILQAGAMGEGGEIFILDMGRPIRILDLARDLIRLHGYEPDRDIPIQFIGLRPGEKLYEELITEGEGIVATAHEKIMVLRGNTWDTKELNRQIDELLFIARQYDAPAIKRKLAEIVPDYTPAPPPGAPRPPPPPDLPRLSPLALPTSTNNPPRTYPFQLKALLGNFHVGSPLGDCVMTLVRQFVSFYPFELKAILGKFSCNASSLTHFSSRRFWVRRALMLGSGHARIQASLLCIALTGTFAFADELYQQLIPARQFDLEDLGWNMLGAISAVAMVQLFSFALRHRRHPPQADLE